MSCKNFLPPLLFFFISFFTAGCSTALNRQTGEVKIVDVRNVKEPEVNLSRHKPGDVEVFRVTFMDEGYKVIYYQKEKGTLAHHEAYYMLKDDFDKASYRWLSDTSVAIRLFNSITRQEKRFDVFGKGSISGLRD